MIDLQTRVEVPEEVVFRELDGEAVLLHTVAGRYFGLDPVGTRMWTALCAGETLESAADALVAEYDVAPERLRRDLEEFVAALVEHELVSVARPAGEEPEP